MSEPSLRNLPSNEEVVTALDQTGFILEHRVAQALRRKGFDTEINWPYRDNETSKSREVDLLATVYEPVIRDPLNIYVEARVVVECKNTPNPFVVVGENRSYFGSLGHGTRWASSFDPLKLGFPKLFGSSPSVLGFENMPGSIGADGFVGRQLVRMNRQGGGWRADNSAVFDSIIYPLAKANRHLVDIASEPEDWEVSADFSLFFSVLVSSGPVFAVNVGEETPEVAAVPWAAVTRDLDSGVLRGSYCVDVVDFRHFDDYIERRIIKTFQATRQKIAENMHLFDPEWLLANRGRPKKEAEFDVWLQEFREHREALSRIQR